MTYERYQNGAPSSAGSSLSSREIQSDLTDIRGEISKTFEAITEKLEPKELIGKLVNAVSVEGGLLKGVASAFDRNPIPIAMIAGGVGYLIYSEMRSRKQPASEPATPAHEANAGPREAVSRVYKVTSLATKAAGSTRGILERGETMLRERPLVLAGLGLAIGAAVAGSTPMTRREQNLFGRPAGDALGQLVGGARQLAEHATETVKEAIHPDEDESRGREGNERV